MRSGKWGWKGREGWTCDSPLKGGITPLGALGNVRVFLVFGCQVTRDCYGLLVGGTRKKKGNSAQRRKLSCPGCQQASTGKHEARLGRPFKAMPKNLDFSCRKVGGESKKSKRLPDLRLSSWIGGGSNN